MSRSLFFSSPMMTRIISRVRCPSWLYFLSRWAWEREGVACSLSIASSKSRCSSFFEEGQLISRIEGDFLFIHHIQQFGNQLRQADIALHLVFTLQPACSANKLNGLFTQLRPNLGTKLNPAFPLVFHSLQLHLVCKGPLSLGSRLSRCKLLSTMMMVAASSSRSRTMTGMVSFSASSLARCRL